MPSRCLCDYSSRFSKGTASWVSFKTLDGGSYAVYSFYDTADKLNPASQFIYPEWLPANMYEPDFTRHNLEFNLNNPAEDPEGRCKIDLFVPIKKCG